MDDSQKNRFSLIVAAMLVTFGREATTPLLTGYWVALRDMDLDQVESAVAKAMQTATRLPVPAELRQIIFGSDSDRATLAWDEVQKATNVSYMTDLDFQDGIINAVIRNLGGRWNFFERINAGAESEKWVRNEFMKSYAVFCQQAPGSEATAPLIGRATHGEESGRSHSPKVVKIAASNGRPLIVDNSDREPQRLDFMPLSVKVDLKRI